MATPATTRRPVRTVTAERVWTATCAAGFAALCALLHRFVTDDAYITARYAENLAAGAGFTFNPGGPRVEGYSNPLLVSVEAFGALLGLPAIGVARAAGVASGLALLAVIHTTGPAALGRAATRAALVIVALSPPLALWAVGGLETLPAALAITAGVLPLCRRSPRRRDALLAGTALAVLPWLRPEGLAVALAVAVAAEAPGALRRRRPALERLALVAGLPLLSQGALEALRFGIYGHALPNSVLYKQGTGATFDVLWTFAVQAAPVLVAALVGLAVARGRRRLLAVPPLVYAIGSIGTLDSVNMFSRFLLPVWPQCALLAALALAAAARGRRAQATASAVVLAAAGLLLLPRVAEYAGAYAGCKQTVRARAADWLRTQTPPSAVYTISDAGLVPARAQRTALDQLMLNEPAIQRTGPLSVPRRVDQLYAARPDLLVLASRSPTRFEGRYWIDSAMHADPRRADYGLAQVAASDGGCSYSLFIYRRSS